MTYRVCRKYWDNLFDLQMESWLEFAWSNRNKLEYKTPQVERFNSGNNSWNKCIGSQKGVKKTNYQKGKRMEKTINTHQLYKKWKFNHSKGSRCELNYQRAVVEMHIFFDYMESLGMEAF